MENSTDLSNKIQNDPDFILLKRFDFSLKRLLEKNPNGVSDKIVAQSLNITEAELDAKYQEILEKLKVAI